MRIKCNIAFLCYLFFIVVFCTTSTEHGITLFMHNFYDFYIFIYLFIYFCRIMSEGNYMSITCSNVIRCSRITLRKYFRPCNTIALKTMSHTHSRWHNLHELIFFSESGKLPLDKITSRFIKNHFVKIYSSLSWINGLTWLIKMVFYPVIVHMFKC